MTQENKDLLFCDLCARLPYGVKFATKYSHFNDTHELLVINKHSTIVETFKMLWWDIEDVKPYLRPMSSMTEEEKKDFIEYAGYEVEESVNGRHYEYYLKDFCGTPDNPSVNADGVDWLNKNMFDFRGLIPKGLAIAVTEDNNPYNKD